MYLQEVENQAAAVEARQGEAQVILNIYSWLAQLINMAFNLNCKLDMGPKVEFLNYSVLFRVSQALPTLLGPEQEARKTEM